MSIYYVLNGSSHTGSPLPPAIAVESLGRALRLPLASLDFTTFTPVEPELPFYSSSLDFNTHFLL